MDISLTSPKAEVATLPGWRMVLGVAFSLYTLMWLVLPLMANETLNRDTIQIVYWGREWQLGYFKHPPVISWLAGALRRVFGPSDAVFYLASEAIVLASFAAIHRLARLYLAPWPAAMAVMALTAMGYYSFIVPNLNHNILVMLPWCLTILLVHHAIEGRRPWAWPALGLCLGTGVLAKYAILMLVPLILAHMVVEPRHRRLLARPGPWLAVAVCGLVASPHLPWLLDHEFAPVAYLFDRAGIGEVSSPLQHLTAPLVSLAKMGGMCGSLLLLLCGALGWPRWQGHALSSSDRLLVTMSVGPVAIVLLLGLFTGSDILVEWAAPFFLPLPVLLLRLFYPSPSHRRIRRFLIWLSGLSMAMGVTYVLIFTGMVTTAGMVKEAEWSWFPVRALAEKVSSGWATVCDGPVPVIVGDSWLAGTASYLLPGQPRVYTEADRRMSPWLSDEDVRQSGAVIVWNRGRPTQFLDLDHKNGDGDPAGAGWFPGLAALEARFGDIRILPDVVLPYGGSAPPAAAWLGLAVVPSAACRR